MTALPSTITRYTGANAFSAEDAHGNVFYAFQKQNDAGTVVMVTPDGSTTEVLSLPGSGRPALECNPLVGLWAVGNKETGSHATPPRYRITAYVPFAAGQQGAPGVPGVPGAGGVALFDAPMVSPDWSGRVFGGGVLIDIPATFGVPPAAAYLIRLAASAGAANVKVRAGTEAAPYFLTLNTQAPGVETHTQGFVPGPKLWVSTAGGAATVWLQVVGRAG